MKFALCSDLHLEFGTIELLNIEGADVLVLSGDICVAKDVCFRYDENPNDHKQMNKRIHDFFDNVCSEFENVIYVMGNHEHYHGDITKSYDRLREHLGYRTNLHIMEKEFIRLGDVTFVCATLWTDMNKEDPLTLQTVWGYMNDYRIIANGAIVSHFRDNDGNSQTRVAALAPDDTVVEHKATLRFIAEVVDAEPTTKFVVVGHHAPSKLSTKPRYEKDVQVNGAYSSDLSEFILDRPQIKVWTHGHTHDNFDYMIGSTRVVANPRGYHMYESQADIFKLQYIEV